MTGWISRIAVVAIICTLGATAAIADDDRFEPVRARVAKALVDHNIPSIAIAVAHKGQIIWEQGFGWADRESRTPADPHTLYSVASVSKPITATGLMVLVGRKQIDLDKPINDYLGQAKLRARVGDASDATVRRVANHTSGLPLHYQFFYADEPHRPPARDETIRRFGYLSTEPGERYHYSNLGYGVLDYVIQRESGKELAEFMREEVFLPLGMTHTSIGIGSGLESHQAIRYTPQGKRIPFYEFDHPGASAVYASAHDLARFAMFHMKEHLSDQRAILSDKLIDEMQQPTARSSGTSGYGIGWGSYEHDRGYHVVQHSGGMPGVSTLCSFIPAERLAIVVLSNSRNLMPRYLSNMIAEAMLPKRESDHSEHDDADSNSSGGPFAPSEELLGTWKGRLATYKDDVPLVFEIKDTGDIHVRLARQPKTLLDGARFQEGWLRGTFVGDIGTDDNRGRPYHLHLDVKLRGETLDGPITAITLPDEWGSSAVTHWVELHRKAD